MPVTTISYKDFFDISIEAHCACHDRYTVCHKIMHKHDFFEAFIIASGNVYHLINGKVEFLEKNTLVFIRPNDYHCYKDASADFEMINISMCEATMRKCFDYLYEENFTCLFNEGGMPPKKIVADLEKDFITERVLELNLYSDRNNFEVRLKCLMCEILKIFVTNDLTNENSMPGWFISALKKMQEPKNFQSGIGALYAISDKTPEHISRTFRKCLNTTPTIYINKLRLNYAKFLLSTSNLAITDICFTIGFESISHFNHLFKKQFNLSPKTYRKSLTNGVMDIE